MIRTLQRDFYTTKLKQQYGVPIGVIEIDSTAGVPMWALADIAGGLYQIINIVENQLTITFLSGVQATKILAGTTVDIQLTGPVGPIGPAGVDGVDASGPVLGNGPPLVPPADQTVTVWYIDDLTDAVYYWNPNRLAYVPIIF